MSKLKKQKTDFSVCPVCKNESMDASKEEKCFDCRYKDRFIEVSKYIDDLVELSNEYNELVSDLQTRLDEINEQLIDNQIIEHELTFPLTDKLFNVLSEFDDLKERVERIDKHNNKKK